MASILHLVKMTLNFIYNLTSSPLFLLEFNKPEVEIVTFKYDRYLIDGLGVTTALHSAIGMYL